jgi:hypothetical protein
MENKHDSLELYCLGSVVMDLEGSAGLLAIRREWQDLQID